MFKIRGSNQLQILAPAEGLTAALETQTWSCKQYGSCHQDSSHQSLNKKIKSCNFLFCKTTTHNK